ncbi:hypothetical protein [Ramlibacter sp. AN1133]|uniref:hypothetical protein n=1 Tax=Ramlibacter sp. AN1133 TaxID=3133429 RepID=UPI0030C3511C
MSAQRFLRCCARIVALVSFLMLAACGGGGGDVVGVPPDVTPADVTPPTLSLVTSSPISVTSSVTIAADEPLADALRVEAVGYAREQRGTAAILGSTVTLAADRRSLVWSNPAPPLPYDWVLVLNVTAQDMSGNTGTVTVSVTTELEPAPPGWPPSTIAPVGTKVFGAHQLPAACDTWRSACWQQSVANGSVKFVTPGRGGPRSVVIAYFRNTASRDGVTGLWNVMPFYLDNGAPLSGDIQSSGFTTEVDYVVGSAEGVILHNAGMPTCTELFYGGSGTLWTPRGVACP